MHLFALLGRPNVGKSTLFNRLTQTRNALVADIPGVTRDRQYGVVEGCYRLVDTGGLVSDAGDIDVRYYDAHYTSAIVEQAEQAAKEADTLAIVTDAHAGVTALDVSIVASMRQFDRNLIVIVNKIDGVADWNEFYQFGIPLYPVAAKSRRGVKQLHQALCDLCEHKDESQTHPQAHTTHAAINSLPVKCMLLGRPNVGKSTLTNRMLGFERMMTCDMSGTTLDVVETELNTRGRTYTLLDSAGLRRSKRVHEILEKFSQHKTKEALLVCDVALLLVNGRERVSEQDMRLLQMVIAAGKALILVVNKWDGMNQDAKAHFVRSLEHKLRRQIFFAIEYISALHGTGVGTLFDVINQAHAANARWLDKRELQAFVVTLLERNPPPLVGTKRIRVKYARQIATKPPTIALFGNQLLDSLEDSYVRYLGHAIRTHFSFFGSPVCLQLQWQNNPYQQNTKRTNSKQYKKMFHC